METSKEFKKLIKRGSDFLNVKYPIICGDLEEAITLFDRENMTIEVSTEAGDLWNKDQTGIKVRERLDIQTVDPEAIIKAEVTVGN